MTLRILLPNRTLRGGRSLNSELEIIRNIAAEVLQIEPDTVPAEASFRNDLFIYTSDIKAIILYAESEFDVHIPEEIAEDLDSIRDIFFAIKNA